MASTAPVQIIDFTVASDNEDKVDSDIRKLMKLVDAEIDESTLSMQVSTNYVLIPLASRSTIRTKVTSEISDSN